MDNTEQNVPSAEEQKAIDSLRSRGFAVTVFNPTEIGEADPSNVEDMMVERGWQTIGDLSEQSE